MIQCVVVLVKSKRLKSNQSKWFIVPKNENNLGHLTPNSQPCRDYANEMQIQQN